MPPTTVVAVVFKSAVVSAFPNEGLIVFTTGIFPVPIPVMHLPAIAGLAPAATANIAPAAADIIRFRLYCLILILPHLKIPSGAPLFGAPIAEQTIRPKLNALRQYPRKTGAVSGAVGFNKT